MTRRSVTLLLLMTTVYILTSILCVQGLVASRPKLVMWEKKNFADVYNENIIKRAKEFGEQNNCDVEVVLMPMEDLNTKLLASIEAKQAPDISAVSDFGMPKYHAIKALVDVTDLFDNINKATPFYPGWVQAATIGGKKWYIPCGGEINLMYYRKDLFDAKGVKVPDTWEELIEAAKKLNDPANGIYGMGFGCSRACNDSELMFREILWSYGSSITGPNGRTITFDSAATRQAVELIAKMFTSGTMPPGVYGWDDGSNNQAYLMGQVAITYNTGSIIWQMRDDKNPLFEKTGLFLIPRGPKGRFACLTGFGYAVMKDTKQANLAKKLIAYLMEPDFYARQIEQQQGQQLPVFKGFENTAFWKDPVNAKWLEIMNYARPTGYPVYSAALGEVQTRYVLSDMIQRIVLQGWTVDRAVKEATARIKEIFSEYR